MPIPGLGYVVPVDKKYLFLLGYKVIERFCIVNRLPIPRVFSIDQVDWFVDSCAYYRHYHHAKPSNEINICLNKCARVATESQVRNWNWPGSTTDREPYGVLCHELGHHCDLHAGENKGKYWSEYSEKIMKASGEPPITSYAPNPAEWFAEIFRLFVTNYDLLRLLRPKAYELIRERFNPVSPAPWQVALGSNVPKRILTNLEKKVRAVR